MILRSRGELYSVSIKRLNPLDAPTNVRVVDVREFVEAFLGRHQHWFSQVNVVHGCINGLLQLEEIGK